MNVLNIIKSSHSNEFTSNSEVPKYRIRPNPNRFLVNKILLLIICGLVLYFAVYLKYYFSELKIPLSLNIIILSSMLLIIALESISSYLRFSNYHYEFYSNRLVINEKKKIQINYSEIINIIYSTNFIDNKMLTGSFIIALQNGKTFRIRYLKNPNQTFLYLQRIVNHSNAKLKH